MYTNAKSVFAATLAEIEQAGPVEARAPDHVAAGRAHHDQRQGGHQLLREQLPRPVVAPARDRGGARGARRARLRPVERALHLRHAGRAQGARGARSRRSSAPRTRSSTRSCFDANGGLFETLLGEDDAIISDALNHASIIDGIRLCKAERHRYEHDDLERPRGEAQGDAGQAPAHDRDRRRVLDGRRHRARSTRSATSPRSTARW